MASARFPPANSNDFRLPSLKDLNFPYKPLQDDQQPWSRSTPLDFSSSSYQPTLDDVEPKRQRPVTRTPHNPYPPPQYAPYTHQQPPPPPPPPPPTYHQLPTSSAPSSSSSSIPPPPPPPPPHEQIHPHAVPMSAYSPYQSQYIPTRPPPPAVHPHHPQQHTNPYPSPGPPPSAPPPQGPWIPPHHQHSSQPTPHPHHQSAPPPPMPPHTLPHHQQPPPPNHIAPHAVTHPPPQVPHLPPAAQPQQQQQQQQQSFSRSTAIVPTNVDPRDAYEAEDLDPMPSLRDGLMVEVVKHCSTLYSFAKNHAQFQTAIPHAQPSPSDLTEMSRLAVQVVHMLEEWKGKNIPDLDRIKLDNNNNGFTSNDDSRPPKRPWEEMSRAATQGVPDSIMEDNAIPDKAQSTAEQDMELIRTKRASSTAGGGGTAGQPKSKYRKRSRATPPGKCHSCNIRETPEWRRGPDGARTLCNACGLHYAKLMRKKEKSGNGSSDQISLEDLRASARSGDIEKARSKGARDQQSSDSASPMEGIKQTTQTQQTQPPSTPQHHQGSFQVMSLAPDSNGPPAVPESGHMQTTGQQTMPANAGPMSVSSHPWPTPVPPPATIPHPPHVNASAARYAPDQFQHQSFMRSSQHVVIPQASSR